LAKQKENNLPYSRKEMVDSLCAKWDSIRESSISRDQLSPEQFRDLARTETDDELFRDCCNSAKKEGISVSEFIKRYV
jgi:catabolite regulation protein CreA